MEFYFSPRIATYAAVGFIGAAGLAACGGEAGPPAPVRTGSGAHEGRADSCRMVLAQNGDKYTGYAEVNGSIPGGSELVFHFTYHGKGLNKPVKTPDPDGRVRAEDTVSAPTTRDGAALWALIGKIDISDSHVNLPCEPVYLSK